MFHQLRRKMLSEACPTRYQFSKGVCRPVSMNQFKKFEETKAPYFDTAAQLMYVDAGSPSHDQCCDKQGMTTIRTESDCRKAAEELRPWGRYLGRVNKNTIPYGCYADIRTQDVGFNSNTQNSNLEGLYEPICGAGENKYEIGEFNIIRADKGYVMGDLGEKCPDSFIVRAEDCRYALQQLAPGATFTKMVGSTEKMAGCSLQAGVQAGESRGFYNDRHPEETDIKEFDPPRYCDWGCYMDRYPDARAYAKGNAVLAHFHYMFLGQRQGRDCKCDGPAVPKGGSYPICYQAEVVSRSRNPQVKVRSYWSKKYTWRAPGCISGFRHSGKSKSAGFLSWRVECVKSEYSCDMYPNLVLRLGRKVPSNALLPAAYCIDWRPLGNYQHCQRMTCGDF